MAGRQFAKYEVQNAFKSGMLYLAPSIMVMSLFLFFERNAVTVPH